MYCKLGFERLQKEIKAGKSIKEIGAIMCPDVKNPEKKIIRMIKVWKEDKADAFLRETKTLDYHENKASRKGSGKNFPHKETPESKLDDLMDEESAFRNIIDNYQHTPELKSFIKELILNIDICEAIINYIHKYPKSFQKPIDEYLESS